MNSKSGHNGGVRASLSPNVVSLAPGGRATVDVEVFNGTEQVDEFSVSLLGDSGLQVTQPPEVVSLFPGDQGVVKLQLLLPADVELGAGRSVVGVRVQSVVHPEVVRVEELALEVMPVTDVGLHLEPQSLKGGKSSSSDVVVANRGTTDVTATLRGEDPEGVVTYRFAPPSVTVPHHSEARVDMRVSGPRRWAGESERRTLNVAAFGPGVEAEASGVFVQRPRLPPIVIRAAMFLGALGAVFVVLFLTGVVPPEESTTTVAPTTTAPPPLAEIGFFRPLAEVGDDGCVDLEWSVSDAESVQLETPQSGTATVEAEEQRTVCGRDGDVVTLSATGAGGDEDTREYVISYELSVGEPTVELNGRTLTVDVVTNQPASVTVVAGDAERTSSGTTNHHLELDDLPSGEVDWDLTASAPDQLDVTRSGSVDVAYYYGRLSVVERPTFISTQTTTTSPPATTAAGDGPVLTFFVPELSFEISLGHYYVFSTDPVYRFLDEDECPDVDGEDVDALIFPLEMDGSGGASVSAYWCSNGLESPWSSLDEAAAETNECELDEGFEPTTIECTLQYEREEGYVEMTVQVERLVSDEEPDYN